MCELACLVWSPCYSSHAWNCFELRFNWDSLKWMKRLIYVCKWDAFMYVIPHCTQVTVCLQCKKKKKRFEIIIHCFSRSFLDTSGCHNGFSPSVMRKVAFLQTLPSITCCSTLIYMSFYKFFFNFCLQSHDVTIVWFVFYLRQRWCVRERDIQQNKWVALLVVILD